MAVAGHVQGYGTIDIGGLTPADAAQRDGHGAGRGRHHADSRLCRPALRQNHLRHQRHHLSDLQWVGHVEDLRPLSLQDVSSAPWANGKPTVTVTYLGDGPQMCYQTILPQDCALVGTAVSNTATGTLDGAQLAPATASVTVVAAPGTCMPTIVTDTDGYCQPAERGRSWIRPRCPGSNLRCSNRTALPDTVTFTLHGPSATASCSGTAVFTSTVDIAPEGTATSDAFTPTQAGTLLVGGDLQRRPAQPGRGVGLW